MNNDNVVVVKKDNEVENEVENVVVENETSGFGSAAVENEAKKKKKTSGSSKKKKAKRVDISKEIDDPIAGQAYGVFSFISPEEILKKKELFYFSEFLRQWGVNKYIEINHQFVNFLAAKYHLNAENVLKDYEDFIIEEKPNLVSETSVVADYKNFIERSEEDLIAHFSSENEFQTCVRGVKNSGNFATQEEASERAKEIRKRFVGHDTFVGPVGTWLVYHPDAYRLGKTEYLETELNDLVQEKRKNEAMAKAAFEKRVRDTKEKAIAENKAKAAKTGAKLTQDIDESGMLIGTQKEEENNNLTIDELKANLFEGDDIVVPNHQGK